MAYTTRLSLLSRVCRGDEVSWGEFYDSYSKLLFKVGRESYSLNDHEIEEVIQETMLTFFGESKTFKYDKSKGKLRNYLKQIFRFKALRFKSKRNTAAEKHVSIESEDFGIEDLADNDDPMLDKIWNEEWNKHIANQTLQEIKGMIEPQTFQIFYSLVVEEVSPKEIAEAFGTNPNNIYAIKNRVGKMVKEHAKKFMDEECSI